MRVLLCFLCLFTSSFSYGSGPRFWIDPQGSFPMSGNMDDGTNSGDLAGYGGGVQIFGFFTGTSYLGLSANYSNFDIENLVSTQHVGMSGNITSGGVMLGTLVARFRVWATYHGIDQFSQTYTSLSSSLEGKNLYKGTGVSVGIAFWVWTHFTLGVEYFQHTYNKDEDGVLASNLKVNHVNAVISFPFEIFK